MKSSFSNAEILEAVGLIIYLELKHKVGMEGADGFYTISNSMLTDIYKVSRQRKYYALKKLLEAKLIMVRKRKGKNIQCRLVLK